MTRHQPELFKGRHFEAEIIVLCVRWYLRYPLSLRQLEEIMAERNLSVDHVTIWRLGPAVRAGTEPPLSAGIPEHQSVVASRREVLSRCGQVDLFMRSGGFHRRYDRLSPERHA